MNFHIGKKLVLKGKYLSIILSLIEYCSFKVTSVIRLKLAMKMLYADCR